MVTNHIFESILSENGRINIPQKLRRLKGYKKGQKLCLISVSDGIKIISQQEALEALQNLVSSKVPHEHSLVEELLKDRKNEQD